MNLLKKPLGEATMNSQSSTGDIHMCWRDDVRKARYCGSCRAEYFGDLGHRNCPALTKKTASPPMEADAPNAEKPSPEHIEFPF